jgi:site-specific DNA-cytosine methylase
VDNPFKSPAVLSVCPGIRGLERGIERAIGSVRTIAYVEIETFIVANLLAAMEAGILAPAPIWSNLKTFPWRHFRGKVDILMGGYPCQPFSNAGLGLAELDPRHLWPYIEGGIRAIKPVCCYFENVAAHLNKGYQEVKQSLEEMGYVVKEGIYTAEEVGAPHLRERLFILAILDDAGCPSWWADNPKRNGCNQDDLFSKRQKGADRFECTGKKLANNISKGLEGFGLREGSTEQEFSLPAGSGCDRFPARPGEQQYEWEEPRTIESGMGCTINGYNFREDLLRALGNSVVEQTAELAFIDLLQKHLKWL